MATTKFIKPLYIILGSNIQRTGWMNFKVILVLLLAAFALVLFSSTASAGCCINERTSYTVFDDVTCNDIPISQCTGTYISDVATCREVEQCGCCVCNPSSPSSIFIYNQNDYSVTENFCDAFCGINPYQLIPFLSQQQCTGQLQAITITGTVRDQRGTPLEGAQVRERGSTSSARTDANGRYSLRIFSSRTNIDASYSGSTGFVSVDTSQRTTNWDIQIIIIASSSRISGKVFRDQTQNPLQGAKVTLSNSVNFFEDISDSQGNYEFSSIPVGDYSLEAAKCGYSLFRNPVQIRTTPSTRDINLITAPKERIEGFVRDLTGNPVSGASFAILPLSGSPSVSDSSGRYAITNVDPNCEYSITAIKRPRYTDTTQDIFIPSEDTTLINSLDFAMSGSSAGDYCSSSGADCRGQDRVYGNTDDCGCSVSEVCSRSTGVCASNQTSCCQYPSQCPQDRTINATTMGIVCPGRETRCTASCLPVLNCPRDQELSYANVNGVCSCGVDVTVDPQTSSIFGIQNVGGKYCCDTASSPFISATPCTFLGSAIIEGTITSAEDGSPLDAEVYVDGILQTVSDIDTGFYRVYVDTDVSHDLEFRRDPIYDPEIRRVQAFRLTAGRSLMINIALESDTRICDYPTTPKVPFLTATNVVCKKEIQLLWENDFCDNNEGVSFYEIKNENSGKMYTVNKTQESFIVDDFSWDTDYRFSIRAFYSDRGQPRMSEKTYSNTINSGQEICLQFCNSEFCATDTIRRRCNSQNRVVNDVDPEYFPDCAQHTQSPSSGISNNWVCAGPDDRGKTRCLEQTNCGFELDNPVPFLGLLFDDVGCSRNPFTRQFSNACYLDRSERTADFCYECPGPDQNADCSLYNSEFACTRNRCGVPGQCEWEDNEYGLLGEGVCYNSVLKDDARRSIIDSGRGGELNDLTNCELCSENSSVYHNVDCTQNVCSDLGLCYSDENEESCLRCNNEDRNFCNQYLTRNSCINSTGKNSAYTGTLFSDDACGIGICYWDNSLNECFKDSNYDQTADCVRGSSSGIIVNPACEQDTVAPETRPLFENLILGNITGGDRVRFGVSEEIAEFNYCMYKYGDSLCSNFVKIYGSDSSRVSGSIVTADPVSDFNSVIDADALYVIRYFSEDLHSNIENDKSAYLYIDSTRPSLYVAHNSQCTNCGRQINCAAGEKYTSLLNLNVRASEAVNCTDYLIPAGESSSRTPYTANFILDVLQQEAHTYPFQGGFGDGNYEYAVECSDSAGNKNTHRETIHLDSFNRIRNARPSGPITDTDVTVRAETSSQNDCYIKIDSGREFVMENTQNIVHLYEANFPANTAHSYELKCYEIGQSSGICDSESYEFAIDRRPPETTAKISSREILSGNWIEVVSSPISLILESEDTDIQDSPVKFGIDYIQYCMRPDGRSCTPGAQPGDTIIYGNRAVINVQNSQGICYSATDKGGNRETVKCGRILFEIPPQVIINTPARIYVTNNPSFVVNGTHNSPSVTASSITISNGSSETSFALQAIGFDFEFHNNFLYNGFNTITAEIRNSAGIYGSDSISAYYDTHGPEIYASTREAQEYGRDMEIDAEVVDSKFTEYETRDGIGRLGNVSAVLIKGSLRRTVALQKSGGFYRGIISPALLPSGFYDIVPGEYDLVIAAEDIFGNLNSERFTVSVEDTRPSSILISVNESFYRSNNLFYTNDEDPEIVVNTDEPSSCEVTITSRPNYITRPMQTANNIVHTYSSSELLRFLSGQKQEFGAEIECRDITSGNSDRTSLRIMFYDSELEILLGSGNGNVQFFKYGNSYEITGGATELKTELEAASTDRREILCDYECVKNGNQGCGDVQEQRMPEFGNGFSNILEETIDYVPFELSSGEYSYYINCSDEYGNSDYDQITVFANRPGRYINTSYSLPPQNTTVSPPVAFAGLVPVNDTLPPFIYDIYVEGTYGKRGIVEISKSILQKEVAIVSGYEQNNARFKLIVDADERVKCRYDPVSQNYDSMANDFMSADYMYRPETSFMLIPDRSSRTLFVSCKDLSNNIAQAFAVVVRADSEEDVHLIDVSPGAGTEDSYVTQNGIVITALTYRDADCSYSSISGGTSGRPVSMQKTETEQGFVHSSSEDPSNLIYVQESALNNYLITCIHNGVSRSKNISFTLDSVNPRISLYYPLYGQIFDSSKAVFNGSTEQNSELMFYVNGVLKKKIKTASGSFSSSIYFESQGRNEVEIAVKDSAGNTGSLVIPLETAANGPRITGIYPLSSKNKNVPELIAFVSGDFDPRQSSFAVKKNGVPVNGAINYDSANKAFSFIPSSSLSDGEYAVEVTPKDSSGRTGFGIETGFVIDSSLHNIDWSVPGKRKQIVGGDILLGKYTVSPRSGLVLGTRNYAVPFISGLTEGINYVNAEVFDYSDLLRKNPKYSNLERVLYADTTGPSADINPKGSTNYTRPEITAEFSEDVHIDSYSLKEFDESGNPKDVEISLINSSNSIFTFIASVQLAPRRYVFEITAADIAGNAVTSSQDFVIDVGEFDILFEDPRYGVSDSKNTKISFTTTQDAFCRYSNIYSASTHASMGSFAGAFDETGQNNHMVGNFTISSEYPEYSPIFVWCRSEYSGEMRNPKRFDIAYDTTKPAILSAGAFPTPVSEYPLVTNLSVKTDDEAKCRYDCRGRVNYNLMEGEFSPTFLKENSVEIPVEDMKNYECNIACMNLAETVSDVKPVSFVVNTSLGSNLTIVSPANGAAYPGQYLNLTIVSNKMAQCAYILDNRTPVFFELPSRRFNTNISGLSVGPHKVDVSCMFGVGSETKSSAFYIDNTPPVNLVINSTGFVCDSGLSATWNAQDNESGIKGYHYSVFSVRFNGTGVNSTNTTSNTSSNSSARTLLYSGFTAQTYLPATNLSGIFSGEYVIEVSAENSAGLRSAIKTSSPIRIDSRMRACAESNPPNASIQLSFLPGVTTVTLVCTDNESGCAPAQLYSVELEQSLCIANETYISPVDVYESSYFCYLVKDNAGNSKYGSEFVAVGLGNGSGCVNDLDCDLILDSADNDIDGDGLVDCPDDSDKDNDGILDYNFIEMSNEDTDDDSDGVIDSEEKDGDNDLDNDDETNLVDTDIDCDTSSTCEDADDDNDGITDDNDADDDNDGILDKDDVDAGGSIAVCDYIPGDISTKSCRDKDNDLDNDKIINVIDEDIDGDGIINSQDDDMDNDGILNCADQDNDNDGYSDVEDVDNSDDWDSDGMKNEWEKKYGLDPLKNDAREDKDKDGLSNIDEQTYRTSPINSDTDGDGYSDYDELFAYDEKYDPTDPKSRPPSLFGRIALIFILLALVGGGGYYYFKNYYNVKSAVYPPKKEFSEQSEVQEERRRKQKERAVSKGDFEKEILDKRKHRELEKIKTQKLREALFGSAVEERENKIDKIKDLERQNVISLKEAEDIEGRLKSGHINTFQELDKIIKSRSSLKQKSGFEMLDEIRSSRKNDDSFEKLDIVAGKQTNKKSEKQQDSIKKTADAGNKKETGALKKLQYKKNRSNEIQ